MQQRQWRLICDCPAAGAFNMGVDVALLEAVGGRQSVPALRLYGWSPPCLSLGYGQRADDVDFGRARALGWDVVRRPTGGRAILHTDELTYSVVIPDDHPLAAGSVVDSYRRLSRALAEGLRELGAQPQADPLAVGSAAVTGPVCFEVPSHYEITVHGRKLVGSAQVRRLGGVLQHGTLPLTGDLSRICEALVYSTAAERAAARELVRARAITLAEALGQVPSWEAASVAVRHGFETALGIRFETSCLSDSELDRAQTFADIYAGEAWNHRR